MCFFKKCYFTFGTQRKYTFLILIIDLFTSVCGLSCRLHRTFFNSMIYKYDLMISMDALHVEGFVPLAMIGNIVILDFFPSVVGLFGVFAERPSYLKVYVMICCFDLVRICTTIPVLSILWINYHQISETMLNLLIMLDSSSFLDLFYFISPNFLLTESQVVAVCVIMFELCIMKWLMTSVVYSYYLEIAEKRSRVTSCINGINALQRYRSELHLHASPADSSPAAPLSYALSYIILKTLIECLISLTLKLYLFILLLTVPLTTTTISIIIMIIIIIYCYYFCDIVLLCNLR